MARSIKTMEEPGPFEGFAPRALDFFNELEAHQTRDWFLANKDRYERLIREPLGQLVGSVALAFAVHDVPLTGDAKTSLFRINRDVRFSNDKRPYKTNASAVLTRDGIKRSQGLVYIHLAPDECFVAAGFYQLEPEQLEAFRRRILDRRKDWYAVTAALDDAGLSLSRDGAMIRLPRGYDADTVGDLADDIRLKSFVVTQPIDRAAIETPELIDTIVALAQMVEPLLHFGWSALATLAPMRG